MLAVEPRSAANLPPPHLPLRLTCTMTAMVQYDTRATPTSMALPRLHPNRLNAYGMGIMPTAAAAAAAAVGRPPAECASQLFRAQLLLSKVRSTSKGGLCD